MTLIISQTFVNLSRLKTAAKHELSLNKLTSGVCVFKVNEAI